ncbi:hypothetical protein NEFER01_0930 [Nematocida sp. LUAm1]|nr:hypothetical protein NEFER02_1266 [Nematocida sp. LUAm2]KAI5177706.1 hypothetical protein NEFER01_0930 [Nematocida sp. LUAm1]
MRHTKVKVFLCAFLCAGVLEICHAAKFSERVDTSVFGFDPTKDFGLKEKSTLDSCNIITVLNNIWKVLEKMAYYSTKKLKSNETPSSSVKDAVEEYMNVVPIMESFSIFIKSPNRKEEYLHALHSLDLTTLKRYHQEISADYISDKIYNLSSKGGQYQIPSHQLKSMRYSFLVWTIEKEEMYKDIIKHVTETIKEEKVYTTQKISVFIDKGVGILKLKVDEYYKTTSKCINTDIQNRILDGFADSNLHDERENMFGHEGTQEKDKVTTIFNIKNNYVFIPFVGVSRDRNTYSDWVKSCMDPSKDIKTIPWAYFDSEIFLNNPISLDIAILARVGRHMSNSFIIGKSFNISEKRNTIIKLEKFISTQLLPHRSLSIDGRRYFGQRVRFLFKNHVYEVLLAYLRQELSYNLYENLQNSLIHTYCTIINYLKYANAGRTMSVLMKLTMQNVIGWTPSLEKVEGSMGFSNDIEKIFKERSLLGFRLNAIRAYL